MKVGENFHLTYCSNIHAGESWSEVQHNLETHLPGVRSKLNLSGPFGIGLRLSAEAALTLSDPPVLAQFQRFLDKHQFYVFTINGFPYGTFHRQRVKEEVYLPDWREPLRLDYTNRLATLLAQLLPEGLQGSVSTVPGAFKPNVRDRNDVRQIAANLLRHAAFLRNLQSRTGRLLSLAIEPEPHCLIETIDEFIRFFSEELLDPLSLRELSLTEADVRKHIGVCFDACHMTVEFEDAAGAIHRLQNSGISIAKIQISSALRLRFAQRSTARQWLAPFAESIYLHQVVEKSGSTLTRYADLPDAFEAAPAESDREWRVHFHVPIFLAESTEGLSTTQNYLADLLALLRRNPVCSHLEVETYTWDVLPEQYRNVDIETAIARELAWVVKHLVHE